MGKRTVRQRHPRHRHNPPNVRSNRQLVYGHAVTHSKSYQRGVGKKVARKEHDKSVRIMKRRGYKHNTPFR